jgi:hypothetical protein
MDNQADIGLPGSDGLEHLIKRDHDKVDLLSRPLEPELQGKEGAGHGSWNSDSETEDILARQRAAGNQHGAIAVSHAGSVGQQSVLVRHIGIGVDADGRDIQLPTQGSFVQGLDILQDVLEAKAVSGNPVVGQREKHECIIRVGRVAER